MAKLDFFKLLEEENLVSVKRTKFWDIKRDNQYYYKFLTEQNLAALNGKMQQNLEFMMEEQNQIAGLNPVSDIYYLGKDFFAYRTPAIKGENLKVLMNQWNYQLHFWQPFFFHFISIMQSATSKNFIFPDLFTDGNILYQMDQQKAVLIDNDGFQIENRWVGYFDSIGQKIYSLEKPFYQKYFNDKSFYYTKDYNFFAFYTWFLFFFFQIDLFSLKENPNHKNLIKPYAQSFESLLQNPTRLKLEIHKKRKNVHYLINEKSLIEKLNAVGLPKNSDLFSRIVDLLNPNISNSISVNDFIELCQNYEIMNDSNSRKLKKKN